MTFQSLPPKKNLWLWEPLEDAPSALKIWFWWEKRRIPFNIFVLILALISTAIYVCSRMTPGLIPSQSTTEDVVPAMALICAIVFGPIAWNIFYSFGPLWEIASFKIKGVHDSGIGPVLMKIGVGVSAFIILLPAIFGIINSVTFIVSGRKLTN